MNLLIIVFYRFACYFAIRVSGEDLNLNEISLKFGHTMLPIAFAYHVTHYLSLLLFEFQTVVYRKYSRWIDFSGVKLLSEMRIQSDQLMVLLFMNRNDIRNGHPLQVTSCRRPTGGLDRRFTLVLGLVMYM